LFVALLLDPAVLKRLRVMQGELVRSMGRTVRWARPEQLHLTLVFLGEVELARIPELGLALREVAARQRPFCLELNGAGVFPDERRPRVIWVGLGGDLDALGRLRETTSTAALGLGREREGRAFVPHLTLGRVREPGLAGRGWATARQVMGDVEPLSWWVRAMHLVRSDLDPGGARHTVLEAYVLS
jgi:RNA 2',3'-cyclic 3'-phosphodiesterase